MSVNSYGSIKTTGQMRELLCEVMERVKARALSCEEAGQIAKLAAQVNESLYSEIKHAKLQIELGGKIKKTGALKVG